MVLSTGTKLTVSGTSGAPGQNRMDEVYRAVRARERSVASNISNILPSLLLRPATASRIEQHEARVPTTHPQLVHRFALIPPLFNAGRPEFVTRFSCFPI